MQKFKTIFFDFDSTLTRIEGIDELARLKGKYAQVSKMTDDAMNGKIGFDEVLEKRLKLIKATNADLEVIADLYLANLAQGAAQMIKTIKQMGMEVHIISGGYRAAIIKSAIALGINLENVHAIDLTLNKQGYLMPIKNQVLGDKGGKLKLIQSLKLLPKIALVGDGVADWETRFSIDRFIAYTGVVERDCFKTAEYKLDTFRENKILALLN